MSDDLRRPSEVIQVPHGKRTKVYLHDVKSNAQTNSRKLKTELDQYLT